jgi:hypothetical protein
MANILTDVSFTITAKDVTGPAIDTAKAGLASLKQKSSEAVSEMGAHWEKFKTNWIAASAAIVGAWMLVQQAWNMAEAGAAYLEQTQLLNALSQEYGTTAQEIVSAMEKAGQGMISLGVATEVASSALAKGITPKQLTTLRTRLRSCTTSWASRRTPP